mgnify:CR=1 FL=1
MKEQENLLYITNVEGELSVNYIQLSKGELVLGHLLCIEEANTVGSQPLEGR